MNKFHRYAFLAVEDSEVVSLNDFRNKLKDMFDPAKTVNEYKGEYKRSFNDREKIY